MKGMDDRCVGGNDLHDDDSRYARQAAPPRS